jgi:hypothetical protein
METTANRKQGCGLSRRPLLLITFLVLLIRLPFLNQAIQGDDVYYLGGAQNAQINAANPNHFRYVFMGDEVDMRGHPHPPLNVWFLAALLALFGDIYERPFHAAYILFSLIAAFSMWALAKRFSPHPLWATLLFIAVPPFVVNGNSLESDLPFLAFWVASVALILSRRYALAVAALALAALGAMQAVFLTPILWVYAWLYDRKSRALWLTSLVPVITLALWQVYERLSTGALPAAVLSGYFTQYGFQAFANKWRNAVALTIHLTWLVFPALLVPAAAKVWRTRDRDAAFLASWIGLFFLGALAVFFAGSARYLLPVAAPVALLVSRLQPKWLALGFAVQLPLSLALATVNYHHWDGYRRFAESVREHVEARRTWINGEWGLRFYLESDGALPLQKGQPVRPGDIVVGSDLAYPVDFTTGGGALTNLAEKEVFSPIPLRLIGLEAKSGYSTATKGFRPFDISTGPIDRVRAELVVERQPAFSYLPAGHEESGRQIVTGLYAIEDGAWRWMAGRAVVLLKSPPEPAPLVVRIVIPDIAPARQLKISLDGQLLATEHFRTAGSHEVKTAPARPKGPTASVSIAVDKTFSVPGDRRELGVIVTGLGFR